MARFARKVEFNAYQFVPEEVTSEFGEGSVEALVQDAFPDMELNDAFIGETGTLRLSVYNF